MKKSIVITILFYPRGVVPTMKNKIRTFVLRARHGTTRAEQVRAQIGNKGHLEVIAHSVMNAFFISNGFRQNVVVYIVLESSADFPRTIKLVGSEGLSIAGFYEEAVIELIERALIAGAGLQKDETRNVAPGMWISGFGFEKCVNPLLMDHTVYLLDPKGEDIRTCEIAGNPVFILSDHLAMPKNNLKSLQRRGLKTISVGKQMLFASQCMVLLQAEMDRRE